MSEAILEYRAPNLRLSFGESIEKEVKRSKQPSAPPSAKPNKVMEKFKQRQNGNN